MHIVLAVAITALGRIGITQLENFTVESFKVGFGNVLMTSTAGVDDGRLESRRIGAGNFMTGVAIVAHGKRVLFGALTREVNTFAGNFVNTQVTLSAGHINLGSVHR